MSETNCMTCMIGKFKDSLCDDRLCKKYAREGSSDDFTRLLLDKDLAVVIRCRDCKHFEKVAWSEIRGICNKHKRVSEYNGYCSWAKRREDG